MSVDAKQVIEAATAASLDREIADINAYAQKRLAWREDNDAHRKQVLHEKEHHIQLIHRLHTADAAQLDALKAWNRSHVDACIARVRSLASNPDPAAWIPFVRVVSRVATETTLQCPSELYAACTQLLEDRLAAEITPAYPNVRTAVHEDDDVLEDEVPAGMTQIVVELILFDNSHWCA